MIMGIYRKERRLENGNIAAIGEASIQVFVEQSSSCWGESVGKVLPSY